MSVLPYVRSILLILIFGLVVAGCESIADSGIPTLAGSATPGPIEPVNTNPLPSPSSTPAEALVWISPAIPEELRVQVERLEQSRGRPVRFTEDLSTADVRVEMLPERALTEWVYVVAAPFPTVTDQISSDQLSQTWSGQSSSLSLAISPELSWTLKGYWGSPAAVGVDIIERESLLEYAWEKPNTWSIIPFQDLKPRWKVIELDSQSPISSDFDSKNYPLLVPYGLSGDPALVADLAHQLAWPSSNYDPEKMTVVLMTGVSALTRATAWRMNGKGIEYPGLLIGDWMREPDFSHISHEVAFSESCPPADPSQKTLRFCADPDHLQLFEDLEVDLIELTGNHVMDWKEDALLYSLDLYEQRDMMTFGGGRTLDESIQPVRVEHNGNKIAWLGCNAAGPSFAWAQPDRAGATPCFDERVLSLASSLSEQGYMLIFTFQWGESESNRPLPLQVEAFREVASAGAVIVQGSQAHRPQSIEFQGESFIHYGLGNLFFDQMQTWPNRQEFLDRHVFYNGSYISTQLLTAILEDYSQPRPTTEQEREALLSEIFQASGW
jgi:poly-gamma-glutamate synthesis protein (capsule biosynthesis protein)